MGLCSDLEPTPRFTGRNDLFRNLLFDSPYRALTEKFGPAWIVRRLSGCVYV